MTHRARSRRLLRSGRSRSRRSAPFRSCLWTGSFASHWTYVTAGLCSPWLQQEPDEVSGFGCELMIRSRTDAPWAAQILRSMAFYIFNHAGTISPGVRIALHAPIAPNTDSKIRNLFVWYADEAPDRWYQLPSGGFGLFTAVGITDDELALPNQSMSTGPGVFRKFCASWASGRFLIQRATR